MRVALPAFVACEPGPPSPPRVGPMPLLPGIAVETAMSRCTTEASAPMLLPPPVPRGPSSWENVTGCLFVPSLLSTQGVLAHEASPSTLFGGGHIEEGFFYFVSGLLCLLFLPLRRAVHQAPSQICVRGRVQLPYLIAFLASVAEHEPSFSFSQHFPGAAPRQHG